MLTKLDKPLKRADILATDNIVSKLDTNDASRIAGFCKQAFDKDEIFCAPRHTKLKFFMRIFKSAIEQKNEYWRNQANVIWPGALDAANEFYCTAVNLLPREDLAKGKVTKRALTADQIDMLVQQRVQLIRQHAATQPQQPQDPQDPNNPQQPPQIDPNLVRQGIEGEQKRQMSAIQTKADAAADYVNDQLTEEMPQWFDDTAAGMLTLPIQALFLRKITYDSCEGKPVHKLILPIHIYFNEGARNVEHAMQSGRISEKEDFSYDEMIEYFASDWFQKPEAWHEQSADVALTERFEIVEMTVRLELDGDDRKEPYVVWFDRKHNWLYRIERLYESTDIKKDKYIKAKRRYIDYRFMPDPEGSVFGMGLFDLLYHPTGVISGLMNNLIDAAKKAVLGGGFYDKNLTIRGGKLQAEPDLWEPVTATAGGVNFANSFFPLPVVPPSPVLPGVIEMLDNKASAIVSIDSFDVSQMPANMPATSAMIGADAGIKRFKAVFLGIKASLDKEIGEIHVQNGRYGSASDMSLKDLRSDDYRVEANIDIESLSTATKMAKMQFLDSILATPVTNGKRTIDQIEVRLEQMRGFGIQNPDRFFMDAPQGAPSPQDAVFAAQAQLLNAQAQTEGAKSQTVIPQAQATVAKTQAEAEKTGREAGLSEAKLQNETARIMNDAQHNDIMRHVEITRAAAENEQAHKKLDMQHIVDHNSITSNHAAQHAKLQQADVHHVETLAHQAEQAKLQAETAAKAAKNKGKTK